MKSFRELAHVWETGWAKNDTVSALAFIDWCRDNEHMDEEFAASLERWARFGGLGSFQAELRRLVQAESAHFARGGSRG